MAGGNIALCAATPLNGGDAGPPEWVHLIPAGEVTTRDGRGPYRVLNMAALAASSLAAANGKLLLDENHAADLAAMTGQPTPARGWIVDLQARSDGMWGRVEWTSEGRRRMADREYRGVSPVISHLADGTITGLLRASLVNQPNFVGLTSLHMAHGSIEMDEVDHAVAKKLGYTTAEYLHLLKTSPEFRQQIAPTRRYFEQQLKSLNAAASAGSLTAADRQIIALMGVDPAAFLATKGQQNAEKGFLPNGATQPQPVKMDAIYRALAARYGMAAWKFEELLNGNEEFRRGVERERSFMEGKGISLQGQSYQLTDADRHVVSLMGLDPEIYRKQLELQQNQQLHYG